MTAAEHHSLEAEKSEAEKAEATKVEALRSLPVPLAYDDDDHEIPSSPVMDCVARREMRRLR